MNELLKELYIHFYKKRPAPQLKAEIEQLNILAREGRVSGC